jgi:hypothetical protein
MSDKPDAPIPSQSRPASSPWRWSADGRKLFAKADEAFRDTYPIADDEMQIALICDDHGWTPEPADRALIRLAPDMAAMLRELEWSGTGRCPSCTEVDEHDPNCRLAALLRELP